MKEHVYKGNKIVEYSDGTFIAFYYAKGDRSGDIIDYATDSLSKAKERIDKFGKTRF